MAWPELVRLGEDDVTRAVEWRAGPAQVRLRGGVEVTQGFGLIESWRTGANHRRYDRRELRRVAIIRVAQSVGVPLSEIREVLDRLPRGKAVSGADWAAAAEPWRDALSARIALLEKLRDQMGHCIGCGCLSVETCPLYNPDDHLGRRGAAGPRRWLGDEG